MSGSTASDDSGPTATRRRPGGRSERVRASVAEAVLELFRRRDFSFGVADVADLAGVHRTTVYRRWPTRADLIAEALGTLFEAVALPDTGSWEGDVHALAKNLARFFADPVEIGVISSLALGADPSAATVVQQRWEPIVKNMSGMVERAKQRGEVDPRIESGRLVELLIGPFVVHTAIVGRTVSRRHVREIADLVVRAGRPSD